MVPAGDFLHHRHDDEQCVWNGRQIADLGGVELNVRSSAHRSFAGQPESGAVEETAADLRTRLGERTRGQ